MSLYTFTNTSKADTIPTGKALSFSGKRYDTLTTLPFWHFKSQFQVIPFSNQDKLSDKPFEIIRHRGRPEKTKYSPSEKKLNPFYLPVNHPKPVKAGELRSTGIANENITYLSDEQGLPSMNIQDILEDDKGFFWIAHGAGFSIYNGVQFYNYNKKNGIPAAPSKIIKDPSGKSVWMATEKGLVNYDGDKFLIYNKESGLPADHIKDIVFDKNNNLWMVCSNKAILKLKNNKVSMYDSTSALPVKLALGVNIGKDGEILINTWDAGVYAIKNNNEILRFNSDERFVSSLITCMYLDSEKNLWIGSYGGGFALVGDSITTGFRPNTGFPYFMVNTISQDHKKKLWFGTGDGGLVCKEKGYLKLYTTKQGLTSNKISCLMHDKAGNTWVGTQDGGINKITPGSFRILSNLDGFTDKTVSRILVNKRGDVLFGTMAGGLYSFNWKYFKHFTTHGFDWKIILGMCEDANGNLYVASDLHGVSKFLVSKNDSIGYDSIQHIIANKAGLCRYTLNITRDMSDNIWLANYKLDPLVKISSDHYATFASAGSVPLTSISAIQADSNDVVWLSPSNLGLSAINGNTIIHYTKKNGLADNTIYHIYSANKKELWIGTANGLSLYNGKDFINFSTSDGLSNNTIASIIMDDVNRIWVATNNGLNCFKKDKTKAKGYSIETYYTTDGLKTNQFFRSSVAFDKSKRVLWWGTQRGAIYLDLKNFDQNKFSPKAQLANISVMDEYLDFNSLSDSIHHGTKYYSSDSSICFNDIKFDSVTPYFNIPVNLSLPYNKNSITFDYYGFSGLSNSKIRYRYQLEGFDETWKNTSMPNIKYSNLKSGDYVFKAQAKLEGLDWSDTLTYKFVIRPPFWETWWFRIAVIIGSILVIRYVFRLRNRQLLNRQKQLETTVAERTDELSKQKNLIEEKHKEIKDSISYAERIQKSFLATKEHLDENLKEYFILFKPKDIVSGDFYWSATVHSSRFEVRSGDTLNEQRTNNSKLFYLVTADSTGHGVPGAIMSLLNITSLEKAIETETEPNAILNTTRKIIIERLSKDGSVEGGKDGMDCSVCVYDLKNMKLIVSSAHNPVWIVRPSTGSVTKEVIEIKADKMPVGKHDKDSVSFTRKEIDLKSGDVIYTLTDGFSDQFGGPLSKKFMSKNLRELLSKNAHLPMSEQKIILETTFKDWLGNLEQIDDVTIIGVRV